MATRSAKGAKGAKAYYSIEEVRSMIEPHQKALDDADEEISCLKAKLEQAKDELEQAQDELKQSEAQLENTLDENGHLRILFAQAQEIIANYHKKMAPLGINPGAEEFIPSGAVQLAQASKDTIPLSWGDTELPKS